MLTRNSPVPTVARGKLRAFIKSQPGFYPWLEAKGVKSNQALNGDLLEYGLAHGLEGEMAAIISGHGGHGLSAKAIADNAQEDENIEAAIMGRVATDLQASKSLVDMLNESAASLSASSPASPASPADIAAILAPVEAFLSPLVRAELEKALSPVIAAANKPPVQIEVEKIVERFTVQNLAPLAVGELPYALPGKKVALGSLFGFKGEHAAKPVTLWDSHGAAPRVDPFYVVDPLKMALLATAVERGTNVWLSGPSGSGKSTMPTQLAAQTGRPCVKFGFTRQTEVADMLGGMAVLADGSTAWQDGALIQAVKRPGTIIVLDELTIAPAGVQAVIQLVSDDHRTITLPTGEVVTCAHGVVFVVADNTRGYGDQTGVYHGTHASNGALVNRFGRMLVIDYMSAADEARALVNHTGCPMPAAKNFATFIARARKLPEMENAVLSLRQMVAFIHEIDDGFSPDIAAETVFLSRLVPEERAALQTMFTLTWSGEFAGLMSGSPVDGKAASPATPKTDTPAGRAFDDDTTASLNR